MGDSRKPAILWQVLVQLHRWTGIAVCLLFALWFVSGIVMLYEPFPSLSSSERLDNAEQLDSAAIQISPAAVVAAVPQAQSLVLKVRDGRPVYLVQDDEGYKAIDAATGWLLPPIDRDAALRIAHQFTGLRSRGAELIEFDQWIVHEGFGAQRPYYRIAMDDPARTVLYASAATGEIRQRTTGMQRVLNAVGAVPHWLYWTAIRKHWSFWDALVWWLSLTALASGAMGFAVGIYRYAQSRRRGGAGWKAFISWWRWHHVLGLIAGVFLLGWIASGWLSMDHGRLFSRATVPAEARNRVTSAPFGELVKDISLSQIKSLGRAAEIELRTFNGNVFFVVRRNGREAGIVTMAGERLPFLPAGWLQAGMQAAFPQESHLTRIDQAEQDLYARAEELPPSARLFLSPGPPERRAYVDALTGELLAVQDASRRAYAWFYYALHTYKFQPLVGHDTLRTTLMLVPLLGGFALSLTGIVIGWRRLRLSMP